VPGRDDLVWYVAYGSNMHAERLAQYLAGARDPRPPRSDVGVWLPGSIYFATNSPIWGGGRAFYDPDLPGPAPARAWLITASQFADIVAQEMYRNPGVDLDLTEVLATGRSQLGLGRYETLLHVGEWDGCPLLTFTAPWRAADVLPVEPSPKYLQMLGAGLMAAHGWDAGRTDDYLAAAGARAAAAGPSEAAGRERVDLGADDGRQES
jgi:hypothetical protein